MSEVNIIGTIGDINPVDHSGGIIGCVDGEYWLDYLEVLEEENATKKPTFVGASRNTKEAK